MFVSSWPWWANILVLIVLLTVKWLGIKYVEKTSWFTKLTTGKSWMATANIVALLNAIGAFVILYLPAGFLWALVLGAIDGTVHWLIAYWRRKQTLPTVSAGNISTAKAWWSDLKSWFTALPVTTYLSIGGWVVSEFFGKGLIPSSVFTSVLTYLKSVL